MLKNSNFFNALIFLNIFENILIIKSYTTYPQYSLTKLHSDPNYIRVMTVYRSTQTKIPQDQLRTIAIVGLINGAVETEKKLEKYLTEKVANLILNVNLHEDDKKLRIEELEKIIERDRNAIKILGTVLDYATHTVSNSQYRNQLKRIIREHARTQKDIKRKLIIEEDVNDRMSNLKEKILDHVESMKQTIQDKTNKTMLYLDTLEHLKDFKVQRNDIVIRNFTNSESDNNVIQSVIKDNAEENSIDPLKKSESTEFTFDEYQTDFAQNRLKRKQSILSAKNLSINNSIREAVRIASVNNTSKVNNPEKLESEKQVIANDSNHQNQEIENVDSLSEEQNADGGGGGGGGGGLPGLIANLSGGEEGSDVGALLGAITSVVSRLFGPGGLDVPSLINSGTSLVAGLLGGEKNFGTVLGEYVGLALDGFSGGGGADLNGQFLGNLIGTTIAELSAVVIQKRINRRKIISDPDNEEGPPKPGLFVRHFVRNFMKAKNRMPNGDSSEENNNNNGNGGGSNGNGHPKNSDSFSFLKHIVSAIAGGITSFILNASLGSSSGSARGSASLSGASSNSSSDLSHHKFH